MRTSLLLPLTLVAYVAAATSSSTHSSSSSSHTHPKNPASHQPHHSPTRTSLTPQQTREWQGAHGDGTPNPDDFDQNGHMKPVSGTYWNSRYPDGTPAHEDHGGAIGGKEKEAKREVEVEKKHGHASHKSLGEHHSSSHAPASKPKPSPSPTSSVYDPLTAKAMGMEGLFQRDELESEDKRSASPEAIRAWEKAHGGQPVNYEAFASAGAPDVHGHHFESRAAHDDGHISDKSREELEKYYANIAARSVSGSSSASSSSAASTSKPSHTHTHTHTGTHTRSSKDWTHKPSVTHTHGPVPGPAWQNGLHNHGQHEHHTRSAEGLNAELLHQAMPHDPQLEHLSKRSFDEYYAYLTTRSIPDFPDHDEVDTSLAGYHIPDHHLPARSVEDLNAELLRHSIIPHPHLDHPDAPSVGEYGQYLRTRSVPDFPDHAEVDTSLAGYHVPGEYNVPEHPASAAITPAPVLKDRSFKSWWGSFKDGAKTAGEDYRSGIKSMASQLKKHF